MMDGVEPSRNVFLYDPRGYIVSGFWQYGIVEWKTFYNWLHTIVVSIEAWAIFARDDSAASPGPQGGPIAADDTIVAPGTYVLLSSDANPVEVGLTVQTPRLRHPTIPNTAAITEHYRRRVRERDPCCLISRLRVSAGDYSRHKEAHIFPCAHIDDWIKQGFPGYITDPAPPSQVGGPTKIDSIQNIILLRGDLHDAWDNYMFGVNPDAGYIVIPFVSGYDDIAGKVLKLDHIVDPDLRPLDELFRDHFLQGILKHMKGAGEPTWDYEDALGGGVMDLSRQDIWGGEQGKARLEFEFSHRLHSLLVKQEAGITEGQAV
ncbi:hypothetical protein SCP_1800040 [Sparassis crispa]|uniref:HNH nuclease domain-containing protein n=1 Tax=Sparassis crispa TaxID=139825 RepID=A0A401H6D5_9APHY|nr:hypothetical protein SCP_1800040 [Sparassis crispa]GBE89982.1 hypothetical protein SCP_1800040 [Sparassis crispa]